MKRDWKPGDVAMVECSDGEWRQATCEPVNYGLNLVWRFPDGKFRRVENSAARFAFVIDPEDADQVDDLCKALVERMYAAGDERSAANGVHPATMTAALRSLITPPKPDEPTGLGAVVEDDEGYRWLRFTTEGGAEVWCAGGGGVDRTYADIAAVKVLSDGVQP